VTATVPPLEADPVASPAVIAHALLTQGVHGAGPGDTIVHSGNIATYAPAPDLSALVARVPPDNARNTITPPSSVRGLTIKGAASASALEVRDGSDNIFASIGSSGGIYGYGGLRAGSLGSQDGIIAGAPVAASQVGLAIKGVASQTGNLAEFKDSAGTVLARINSAGGLKLGSPTAEPVVGEIFTQNRIIASQGQPHQVQLIAVNTNAAVQFGSAGDANLVRDAAGSLTVEAAGTNPSRLRVKGTASQGTTNLQEWQNSNGDVRARINSIGDIITASDVTAAGNITAQRITTAGVGAVADINALIQSGAAANKPLVVKGAASQSANLLEARDSADAVKASIAADGSLYVGTAKAANFNWTMGVWGSALTSYDPFVIRGNYRNTISAGSIPSFGTGATAPTVGVEAAATTSVPLALRGAASQTADFLQARDSADSVLARITSQGRIGLYSVLHTPGVNLHSASSSAVTANAQEWHFSPIADGAGRALAFTRSGVAERVQFRDAGDVELVTAGTGVILKSPDGTRYRVTVTNLGVLQTAAA
jgi:hypothetical protein